MADQPKTLENLLTEDRVFPPTDEFAAAANAKPDIYEKAEADYLGFWKEQALDRITWFKEPTVVLDDSNPPITLRPRPPNLCRGARPELPAGPSPWLPVLCTGSLPSPSGRGSLSEGDDS